MAEGDVTTKLKRGHWENSVEGRPELSSGFTTKDEALQRGQSLAAELGTQHTVAPYDPEDERNAFGYDEAGATPDEA
ncbi:DUF2188 domain-containing protein [Desertivibrio insolitus]|uniref:DUF2188 domain-containing protein n=1 Tax=Herbiconiux sp. SYSU D00978 TaxID=2812562 RepID=UPI001A963702|nr:DUF2188 domain-containing protein [Herbiconiux sp. SYSU D00978]